MIIFEPGGNKTLALVILVVLSTAIIAWQWVASDPFSAVKQNQNLVDEIQEITLDSFLEVKDEISQNLEDLKDTDDELDKQLKQDELLDVATRYLKRKIIDNQIDCEEQDGEWKIWGENIEEMCNLFTSDADKECSDSSECEGLCVADVPEIYLKLIDENGPIEMTGNCTARTITPGCFSVVHEGFVDGIACD
jgi:hypothetical protein